MNESDQKAKAEARVLAAASLGLVFLFLTSFAHSGERESPLVVLFSFGLPIAATICVIVLGARVTGRVAPGAPGRGKPIFFMVLGIMAGLGALFLRLTAESRAEERRASHDESAASPAAAVFPQVKAKAEGGDAASQFELGGCYEKGEGVAKNQVEAVKWYRKAAEQNYASAQYNLGFCYSNGYGVTRDDAEAVKWYRKAAEQGLATAQSKLGMFYARGEGVAKDQVEAVKWYRKAAEQNRANAQNSLAASYADGEGVTKDPVEAYKWWLLAAKQGEEDAKKAITKMESAMTPAQIAEGQKRAREFKPR